MGDIITFVGDYYICRCSVAPTNVITHFSHKCNKFEDITFVGDIITFVGVITFVGDYYICGYSIAPTNVITPTNVIKLSTIFFFSAMGC